LPNQLDFSAELSKAARRSRRDSSRSIPRRRHPVRTQYAQSGMKGQIPLLHRFHHRRVVAAAAQGSRRRYSGAQQWVNDLPNDENKKFVADYKEKYKSSPSFLRRADLTTAAILLDGALKETKGDMDKDKLRKAIEKAPFKSVRAASSSGRTTFRSRTSTCRMR